MIRPSRVSDSESSVGVGPHGVQQFATQLVEGAASRL